MVAVLRGIWHRRGLSTAILIVAVVAVAATALGPIWYSAAGTSTVRDTISAAPATGQVIDVTRTADPSGPDAVRRVDAVKAELRDSPDRWYAPPTEALEFVTASADERKDAILAWRSGCCAHLTFTAGRCPHAPNEVLVSAPDARTQHIGSTLRLTSFSGPDGTPAPLRVVGVYRPKNPDDTYWAGRDYFGPVGGNLGTATSGMPPDAIFTTKSTFESAAIDDAVARVNGRVDVTVPLRTDALSAADAEPLRHAVRGLLGNPRLHTSDLTVTTTVPDTLTEAIKGHAAFSVPLTLVTVQLMLLCWLLLFLVVNDAVEARGAEIALAKLRGLGRFRLLGFGLAEPLVLLIAAWPLGVLVGRLAAGALAGPLLRADTPASLGAMAWLVGLGATVGGLPAAGWAARATLTRSVTEQWRRRSGGSAARRGWVLDAVLLALAAAALVEMVASGGLAGDDPQPIALLTPGIVSLAAAVLASRVLPPACRALHGRTRRRGGIGAFLALRQIARRPGGARTTIVLATSFALATYAVAAWAVAQHNYRSVARTTVGAATVLTVAPHSGTDLAAVVDRADPGGRSAVAVDAVPANANDGTTMLAVDTRRFAAVAHWQQDFADAPLPDLLHTITPSAVSPVRLTGDKIRVKVATKDADSSGHLDLTLNASVRAPGANGLTPAHLGPLDADAQQTLDAALPSCAQGCALHHLYVESSGEDSSAIHADLRITSIEQRVHGTWQPVTAALGTTDAWRFFGDVQKIGTATVRPDGPALRVRIDADQGWGALGELGFGPNVAPATLPVIATPSFLRTGARTDLTGLDGQRVDVTAAASAHALPGMRGPGLLVDRRLARNIGSGTSGTTLQQVWVAPGAAQRIRERLTAAGVTVLDETGAAARQRHLARQGPGLALVLLLAEAVAATLLAIGGVILGLYATGRRRGYELSALDAAGARRGALRAGLLIEQGVVLGFGALAGFAVGWATAWLTLPAVPEFATRPAGPPLSYVPAPAPLVLVLVGTVLLVALAAGGMTGMILRRTRADRLREVPA